MNPRRMVLEFLQDGDWVQVDEIAQHLGLLRRDALILLHGMKTDALLSQSGSDDFAITMRGLRRLQESPPERLIAAHTQARQRRLDELVAFISGARGPVLLNEIEHECPRVGNRDTIRKMLSVLIEEGRVTVRPASHHASLRVYSVPPPAPTEGEP